MVPIIKKGEREEYKRTTLMSSAYKVYSMIMAERLKEEIERGGILLPNRTGFRKRIGTIDNIYVLNYLINWQLGKKGRVVALFMDLKGAFDSEHMRILTEKMRGKGIKEEITERVVELQRETRSRVRMGGETRGSFWTVRGIRQDCPLSPLLFNLLMANMEKEIRKIMWGGIKLEEDRIYTLAYADDMVLLVENEEETRSMIERLQRYLERKGLKLNTENTKIMRFKKGGERLGKSDWRWKRKRIEEIKEFKYLGYVMQRNGGRKA